LGRNFDDCPCFIPWANISDLSVHNGKLSLINILKSSKVNSDLKLKGQKYRYSKVLLMKSLGTNFFTCIVPDYVGHESPKELWKNLHFEDIRADCLSRCQNSLWQISSVMMHFQT
jgi:hypothetical protein